MICHLYKMIRHLCKMKRLCGIERIISSWMIFFSLEKIIISSSIRTKNILWIFFFVKYNWKSYNYLTSLTEKVIGPCQKFDQKTYAPFTSLTEKKGLMLLAQVWPKLSWLRPHLPPKQEMTPYEIGPTLYIRCVWDDLSCIH